MVKRCLHERTTELWVAVERCALECTKEFRVPFDGGADLCRSTSDRGTEWPVALLDPLPVLARPQGPQLHQPLRLIGRGRLALGDDLLDRLVGDFCTKVLASIGEERLECDLVVPGVVASAELTPELGAGRTFALPPVRLAVLCYEQEGRLALRGLVEKLTPQQVVARSQHGRVLLWRVLVPRRDLVRRPPRRELLHPIPESLVIGLRAGTPGEETLDAFQHGVCAVGREWLVRGSEALKGLDQGMNAVVNQLGNFGLRFLRAALLGERRLGRARPRQQVGPGLPVGGSDSTTETWKVPVELDDNLVGKPEAITQRWEFQHSQGVVARRDC